MMLGAITMNEFDANLDIEQEPLKVSVLREELVKLTKDSNKAIVLNQFIYWSERTKTARNFVKEEMIRVQQYTDKDDADVLEYLAEDLKQGWIYKAANELIDDTMLTVSKATMTRIIKDLLDNGWIMKRKNPRYNGDNTPQYRVNLMKIQIDLYELGYSLNGYKLISQFVDFAEVKKFKDKYDSNRTMDKPNNGTSTQNETGVNHSDSTSIQNETTLLQNETSSNQIGITPLQNETTLPKITETTTEITSESEEEELNIIKKSDTKLGELIKIAKESEEFSVVIQMLFESNIELDDVMDIATGLKSRGSVNIDAIKQQLDWIEHKSKTEGIGNLSKYFLNGYDKRVLAIGVETREDFKNEFKRRMGIDRANTVKVPMHNWLDDE